MPALLMIVGIVLIAASALRFVWRANVDAMVTAVVVLAAGVATIGFAVSTFFRDNFAATAVLVGTSIGGGLLALLAATILVLRSEPPVPRFAGGIPVPLIGLLALVGASVLVFPYSDLYFGPTTTPTASFNQPEIDEVVVPGQAFSIFGKVDDLRPDSAMWLVIGPPDSPAGYLYFTSDGPTLTGQGVGKVR